MAVLLKNPAKAQCRRVWLKRERELENWETTPCDTEPLPDLLTTPPVDAVHSPNLSTTLPCDPTSKYSSITKARKQAVEKLPDWMSKGKTSYAMTKRNKRTTLEMNRENFNDQFIKGYYDT